MEEEEDQIHFDTMQPNDMIYVTYLQNLNLWAILFFSLYYIVAEHFDSLVVVSGHYS